MWFQNIKLDFLAKQDFVFRNKIQNTFYQKIQILKCL